MTPMQHQRHVFQRLKDRWHANLAKSVSFPLPLGLTQFIKAVFEPTNLNVYEQLIPPGLAMPKRPLVQFEFLQATPGWREASFNIACRHGDNEGWLGLYWPIDSYLGYKLGRLVGYPKHLANRMTYRSDAQGAHAEVVHRGRTEVKLDFTRHDSHSVQERQLADAVVGPELERPHYLQVPPGRGPSINRLSFEEVRPLVSHSELGTAQLTTDVDQLWTVLLPKDGRIAAAKFIERRGQGFGWLVARRMAAVDAAQEAAQGVAACGT